jgi:hypothetical protein
MITNVDIREADGSTAGEDGEGSRSSIAVDIPTSP